MDKDLRRWFLISLSAGASLSMVMFLTYYIYKINKKNDPRIKEVTSLIHEAERLINLGKKK